MVKYNDILPDRIITIEITEFKDGKRMIMAIYYFSYRDGSIEYHDDEILVIDAGDDTLLIVNPGGSNEEEYYLGIEVESLLEGSWALSGESGYNGQWIGHHIENFKEGRRYNTGAKKLFAFVLHHFR
ncbi:hypothetical protein ACFLXG_04425 [Chloroflexota bacterium]